MASFCLTKQAVQRFKEALRNREIDPAKLQQMTSEERRAALTPFVGEENAVQVNSLFESKLLLKNQKAGMISWAKKVAGITPEVKRDLLSKINSLDKALSAKELDTFLGDLVQTRLGLGVTEEEAKTIFELSRKVNDLKSKASKDGVFSSEKERLDYGMSQVLLEKYVNDIKLKSNKLTFRENPGQKIGKLIFEDIPGTLKSVVASFDNSLWGRQGIKTLADIRTSRIWLKNFLKSWVDIGRELKGVDAIDVVKADIYSRPNALNGKYKAGNYGLEVLSEEAYPSSIPERIPVLGRLFKASESAYNGGALRLRADLADRFIKIGEQNGLNMLNKSDAEGMGRLVGSLTGRGSYGKADVLSKEANLLFFSVKFLKANIDTLTFGMTDSKIRSNPVARAEAIKSSLFIIGGLGAILTISNLINPDSVDEDPRSTNFGKIKMFGNWVDITGGMGGLVKLVAQLAPSYHDGKWSSWKKTSSGKWLDLRNAGYGSPDGWDTLIDGLISNKLSPVAGLFRDYLKGKDYDGKPVTPESVVQKMLVPLSVQTFNDMLKDPTQTNILESIILEGLGFSTSSTKKPEEDWISKPTKKQEAFIQSVGKEKAKQANEEYNKTYQIWLDAASRSKEYKKLSEEGKQKLQEKAKNTIQTEVFDKYGFTYETPDKTDQQINDQDIIDNLAP